MEENKTEDLGVKNYVPQAVLLMPKERNIFKRMWHDIKRNWPYYLLFLVPFSVLFVFNFLPLVGMVVAFKDYNAFDGVFNSPFASPWYANFEDLFAEYYIWKTIRNTLLISVLRLIICFPAPIFLALIINEIKVYKFKRVIQTILYLPNFLSWVILAGVFNRVLASGGETGMVNEIITALGGEEVEFLTDPVLYLFFLVFSDMWKNTGFASILYIAAIASADVSPYEAAKIDGASRWKIMWYITVPVLIPTIVLQLILQISNILEGGFTQIRQTYSPYVYEYGDIIDTYIYRTGLKSSGDYGVSSALGFFKSIIGFVLVLITNKISDKLTGEGIF